MDKNTDNNQNNTTENNNNNNNDNNNNNNDKSDSTNDSTDPSDVVDGRYDIYLLAQASGYTGTYEEWLASVKGDSVNLRVSNGFIQWKYSKDSTWTNLLDLSTLVGENTNTVNTKTYTVSFVTGVPGWTIPSQTVNVNENPVMPTAKEGYVITGLRTKRGTEWNFDEDYCPADYTLYVEYKEGYTVNYAASTADYADLSMLPLGYSTGEVLPRIRRSGYKFLGWDFGDGVCHKYYDTNKIVTMTPVFEAINEGNVFKVLCWNDEFRSFFNKYVSDEGVDFLTRGKEMDYNQSVAKTGYHINGVEVLFEEHPSEEYQTNVDTLLNTQNPESPIDMILAESDYIVKYVDSDLTREISSSIDLSNTYDYTRTAVTDSNGKLKGVSFQCCPSGMIYNRVIARQVLGTDDPAVVQTYVSNWTDFNNLAQDMKNCGYYMTASSDETGRIYFNNATAWVNNGVLSVPTEVDTWLSQAKNYVDNGYTVAAGVWDAAKNQNIKAGVNNSFCCFGPYWYYSYCMGDSAVGDWAFCKGPQAHFWGGTWMLEAAQTDNHDIVTAVMDDFINDPNVLSCLVIDEHQFVNNKYFNQQIALSGVMSDYMLGGQNTWAIQDEIAREATWSTTRSVYDYTCNSSFGMYYINYLNGSCTKDAAYQNFYNYILSVYPNLTIA